MDITVEVTGGKVRGRTTDGISAFLGIPYAATPVGPTRFDAPKRVTDWHGVRDATAMGASCLQSQYPPGMAALLGTMPLSSGDYLTVNVWTPEVGAAGLPVMVWIHGGAFTRGSNAIPVYDGSAFARDGVVLVAINYRLGISGFAAVDGAPTNRGLRDQLFALEWVQDNIRAFGGDPGNVTIFGESAGGMSVATLLASPAARGLFGKVIMQSGNGFAAAELDDARVLAARIAEKLGVAATARAFAEVDPARLQQAQDDIGIDLVQNPDPEYWGPSVINSGLGVMSLFPVIDGDVVHQLPIDAVAAGAGRGIALLAGTTEAEYRLFSVAAGIHAALPPEALPVVLSRHGIGESAIATYFASRPGATAGQVLAAILTDLVFRSPTLQFAQGHAAAGSPAYAYEFSWQSPVADLGACHTLELPFVFDTLNAWSSMTGPNPPQQLADEMHSSWTAFAKTGDPGWPRFDAGIRPVMTFDAPISKVIDDPRADDLACLPTR